MSLGLYLGFVLAVAALVALPGPNVAMIVAATLSHGLRAGLRTMIGTLAGISVQLAVAALVLAGLVSAPAGWFAWLRWLGAIYLVWLGIGQWRAPGTAPDGGSALHPARAALVSLTNPKTILFLVAFFPQFVVPGPGMRGRIVGLCLTYLAVCVVGDGLWALLAARVAPLLSRSRSRSLPRRISGGILIAAGLGFAALRG